MSECDCYRFIHPDTPHQCQICKRNFSACLYISELQFKLSAQADEISQLKNEATSYEQEIRQLKLDYEYLNSKYMVGMEHVAEIQHQKEQADLELEELSAKLFEEANYMVSVEKKKQHQLNALLRHTEDQLITEQSQLYELRNRIESTIIIAPPPYIEERNELKVTQIVNEITNKPIQCNSTNMLQYDLFRKFMLDQQKKRRDSGSSLPSIVSDCGSDDDDEEEVYSFFALYPHQPKSEYITRCEIEDVEPCLQFGQSNSRLCMKTLMEHLSRAPCFIESITVEEAKMLPLACNATTTVYYRPIWERITCQQPERPFLLECSACGGKSDRKRRYYRFRLKEDEDWLLIEQNCRDRLVAVCDFYGFVRNIQFGYYHQRTVHDLFLENIERRLTMFNSRMGL